MANPDPEITPEEAQKTRDDVIIATGRSDYPNQVNNVLGFPYIFRGALDVRAKTINMEMKIAAARALADLAREDVPDEVAAAYRGARPRFGRDYIIPVPFDPRLIHVVPIAVAKAAMASGVARRPIVDLAAYKSVLVGAPRPDRRRDATDHRARPARAQARRIRRRRGGAGHPRRLFLRQSGSRRRNSGRPRGARARPRPSFGSRSRRQGHRIHNARLSHRNATYAQFLYERLQRKGYLFRDCQRMINQDRNYFGAAMVARGDADAIVTGVTRSFSVALEEVRRVIDDKPGHRVSASRSCSRAAARFWPPTPRSPRRRAQRISPTSPSRRRAWPGGSATSRGWPCSPSRISAIRPANEASGCRGGALLNSKRVNFEYDGEMSAEVALNKEIMGAYPFCRLKDTANVLIMPAFHSAAISTRMLQELGGATVIGPLIVGLERPVQIVSLGAKIPTSSTWRRWRASTSAGEPAARNSRSPSSRRSESVLNDFNGLRRHFVTG